MIRPDRGQYPITQGFRENAAYYGKNGALIDPLGYGTFGHTGIDIGTPLNTPLVAGVSGVVVGAGFGTYTGFYVKIKGSTHYVYTGHMRRLNVSVGQQVSEGQDIGLSGNTGLIPGTDQQVGAHVHWEVQTPNLQPVNGLELIGGSMDYKSMWESADRIANDRLRQIREAEEQIKGLQAQNADLNSKWQSAHNIAEDRLNSINALVAQKTALEKQLAEQSVSERIAVAVEKLASK